MFSKLLDEFCNEKWEIAKAMAEKDGKTPFSMTIIYEDKFEEVPDEICPPGVPFSDFFGFAISKLPEINANAVMASGMSRTIKLESEKDHLDMDTEDDDELEQRSVETIFQQIHFKHGAGYVRLAEKTTQMNHIVFQDVLDKDGQILGFMMIKGGDRNEMA